MLDGTAATHALLELEAVRAAIDEGRHAEAALRIDLLEAGIAGRDASVVGVWHRLLAAERARVDLGLGEARPA